ncbi:hypothetical protein D3C80_1581060 [compost metagenome]
MALTTCDAMETVAVLEIVDGALLLGHTPELATSLDIDLFGFENGQVVATFNAFVHGVHADNGGTVAARSVCNAMDPLHEGEEADCYLRALGNIQARRKHAANKFCCGGEIDIAEGVVRANIVVIAAIFFQLTLSPNVAHKCP